MMAHPRLCLGPPGLMLTHRAVLGLCWDYQTLAHLGAHAGPCWAYAGTNFCDLGLLRAFLGLCCFFGLSWAYVGPSRRHLGAMLGPPGPMFAHHGAILGLCWALQAPSWGYVGPSWAIDWPYIGPSWVCVSEPCAVLKLCKCKNKQNPS